MCPIFQGNINGQQRVIALNAAILGGYVINEEYKKVKIQIAFNPLEDKFEVFNPAIAKDNTWLPDISKIISDELSLFALVDNYCAKNKDFDRNILCKKIEYLKQITKKQIGVIELDSDLDIETVTEIFFGLIPQVLY